MTRSIRVITAAVTTKIDRSQKGAASWFYPRCGLFVYTNGGVAKFTLTAP